MAPDALAALIPLVYEGLHQLAAHYLRMERRGHTLQSTALIHEAACASRARNRVASRSARISSA
jgi:hypothetical protein